MGKAEGESSDRRAGAAWSAWLACMGLAAAAPAFGQQTAAQLDDLTRTMTQYSQPKASAQPPPPATAAKAQASGAGKHFRRSVAPPREPPALARRQPAASAAEHALSSRDAAVLKQVPAAAIPAPSALKPAATSPSPPPSMPPAGPARMPAVAASVASAAPAVTSTVAPGSKASGTAGRVAGQHDGNAPVWRRPWSWLAGAAALVLLVVEVVGWRRHHRRKRDAKVLANIVPAIRPGDREADYHPRPSQSPDRLRQFGAP